MDETLIMTPESQPDTEIIDALPELQADEAELLQRAQQGDFYAFADLRERCEPQILRFVRRLVGDDEADDITQEVFIALFKNLHSINPPGKLRPWLFRCARNRAYDELRARGRYTQITLDEEPIEAHVSFAAHDESVPPEDAAHWLLLYMQVQLAIDKLPEVQRQSLILFAEEGLTYPEIAEVMGCSIGTAKSRVFYAKRGLRGLLSPSLLEALDFALGDENEE